MASGNVLIRITILDGTVLEERRWKPKVEVGEVLLNVQEKCKLSKQSAKLFSLYSYEQAVVSYSNTTILFREKVFVDQRVSSRKLMHHFNPRDDVWNLYYGIKFYPMNLVKDEQICDVARQLFFRQVCKDIQDKFLSLEDECIENGVTLTALMLQVCGTKLADCTTQSWYPLLPKLFQCEGSDSRVGQAVIGDQLISEMSYSEASTQLFSRVRELPGYGCFPFIAKKVSGGENGKLVIISSGAMGICIKDYNNGVACDMLEWETISKVSYKASKFLIKHKHSVHKNVNTSVFLTESKRQAKWMWKSTVDQHGFFRLAKTEPYLLPIGTLIRRKSSFRFHPIVQEQQGKYVIGNKGGCDWCPVETPSTKPYTLDVIRTDVMLCYLPKFNEYHYEITQDKRGTHHIQLTQEGQEHVCVEAQSSFDEKVEQ